MKENTRPSNTKQLILEAAFSFYKEPRIVNFTLNEVASRVNISKPAIYRHFANKDSLIKGMHDYFVSLLAKHLLAVQEYQRTRKTEINVPFATTIQFFADNPQYINYFINQFTKIDNYSSLLQSELKKYGVKDTDGNFDDFSTDERIYKNSKSIYCGMSLLFFIKEREKTLTVNNKDNLNFAFKLVNFLLGGLKKSPKGHILSPTEISKERKAELAELCAINPMDFPKEDKIFTALATVINNYGVGGITLERIASQLNMAKSSLYFYFDNKNQMIRTLILKELSLLVEICRENSVEARNYSENIYITMLSELEYFLIRPSLLPICAWLIQDGSTSGLDPEENEINNIWEKKMENPLKFPDLDFDMQPSVITNWIGIIPVALIIAAKKKNIKKDILFRMMDTIFNLLQKGLDCNEK